ncbi:MAG: hypothetical protein CMH60_04020 [Myxococcales bacterium]|nr:hypothetical protein [Myxococcales bacterium]
MHGGFNLLGLPPNNGQSGQRSSGSCGIYTAYDESGYMHAKSSAGKQIKPNRFSDLGVRDHSLPGCVQQAGSFSLILEVAKSRG